MTADPPATLAPPAPALLGRGPGRRARRLAARLARPLLRLVLAAFRPRAPGVADFSDRQLADIGLARHDLAPRSRDAALDAALALRFGRGR